MTVRWLTVFLDFPDDSFDAGVSFWRSVTGYGLSPARGTAGEFATLLPPSGDAFLRVQRLASGGGDCHLDLHVDTAESPLAATADRAVALGARVRHHDPAGLIVAESPGGFTFCLVPWDGESVPPPAGGASDGSGSSGSSGSSADRVRSLCLDVPQERFGYECSFWSALTDWTPLAAAVPGFTRLREPQGMPVALLLQRLEAAAAGQPVRGHVDLDASDFGFAGQAGARAVARHVGLGARVIAAFPHRTVLADPAGRTYCLVARS